MMRTLALVPLRRDGARERSQAGALLERAIGRTEGDRYLAGRTCAAGFLDGVLPFLRCLRDGGGGVSGLVTVGPGVARHDA